MRPETQKKRRRLAPDEQRAAAALKAIWLSKKPTHRYRTQTELAENGPETWNQGVVTQYMNGVIPLNLPAVIAFGALLDIDDLSEIAPDAVRAMLRQMRPADRRSA